ncbi:hypothetical protein D3C72_2087990 [compost metagenome]
MRGIHGLRDLEAEAPEVVAEGHGTFPVDRRCAPGIAIAQRVRDHVCGGIGNAIELRDPCGPCRGRTDQSIILDRTVRLRQGDAVAHGFLLHGLQG